MKGSKFEDPEMWKLLEKTADEYEKLEQEMLAWKANAEFNVKMAEEYKQLYESERKLWKNTESHCFLLMERIVILKAAAREYEKQITKWPNHFDDDMDTHNAHLKLLELLK